jgi:hypothetical protein
MCVETHGLCAWTLEKLNGERTVETRYFIASITDIQVFAASVRGHWQLDCTFKDDQNTTTRKQGAQNLQTIKRVALAILSLVQSYYTDKRKQLTLKK